MRTNFLEIGACNEWLKGETENLVLDDQGFLELPEGVKKGTYLSPVEEAPCFENLVVSWNVSLSPDTFVRVEAQIHLHEKDLWTPWVSYGNWSPYLERRSCSGRYPAEDPVVRVNCDIVETLGEEMADAWRIRVTLERMEEAPQKEGIGKASRLRRLGAAIRNQKHAPIPVREEQIDRPIEGRHVLSTPACSQMNRDPEIGNCICNPTTMTVLMADRGVQELPEVMALSMVDLADGFGNWAYDAAMGSMYGFRVLAKFGDFESLRQELDAGRSVGISCAYANTPEKAKERDLPYVENGPCCTPGHILTVRGYSCEDGQEWVYVSDSAADSDEGCLLRYKKEQFMEAWTGFHYVMDPEPETEKTIPLFTETKLIREDGKWHLEGLDLTKEMLTGKQHNYGRGTLMARISREYPEPRMDSNDRFFYPEVDENGLFELPEGTEKVYAFLNNGLRLIAQ